MTSHELPEGWEIRRLDEVVDFRKRPKGLKVPDPCPFVPMSAISEDGGPISDFEWRDADRMTNVYFEDGDLLYARITPCFENGKQGTAHGVPGGFGFATTEAYVLVAGPELRADYLAHFLKSASPRGLLKAAMEGVTGRARVPKEAVAGLLLPVPPLPEQQAIVAAIEASLDQLRSAEASLSAARAHYSYLRPSLLGHLYGQPDWPTTSLGVIADVISGITKGRRTNSPVAPRPFLRAANVRGGCLDLESVVTYDTTDAELERYRLQFGDVLMIEGSGSRKRIGEGWLWQDQVNDCIHQNHVFRARLDPVRVRPLFFAYYLQSAPARAYFWSVAKTTSGLNTISKAQLTKLPVPVPSLAVQDEVLGSIESALATEAGLSSALLEAERGATALRSAILFDAFTARATVA